MTTAETNISNDKARLTALETKLDENTLNNIKSFMNGIEIVDA